MYAHKYIKYKNKYAQLKFDTDNEFFDKILEYINIKHERIINILAMGEATHGQERITKLRLRVFKEVAVKYNFTVFVLEENYGICELINDWIHGESMYDLDYLMFQLMWPWRSIRMRKMIRWMKRYNENNDGILEFRGIDVQKISTDYRVKNDTVTYVEKIISKLKLANETSTHEMAGYEIRDKAMFKMFMRMYTIDKKYFFYAHQSHLAKLPDIGNFKNLGSHLFTKFNTQYLVIGNSFNGGSYLGINFKNKRMEIATIVGAIDFSKIKIWNETAEDFTYAVVKPKFKLNNGITTSDTKKFNKKYVIGTGAAADQNNPYYYLSMYQIKGRYDCIIQIPNETALVLLMRKK